MGTIPATLQEKLDKLTNAFSVATGETVTSSVGYPVTGVNLTFTFETVEGRDKAAKLHDVLGMPAPTTMRGTFARWSIR